MYFVMSQYFTNQITNEFSKSGKSEKINIRQISNMFQNHFVASITA